MCAASEACIGAIFVIESMAMQMLRSRKRLSTAGMITTKLLLDSIYGGLAICCIRRRRRCRSRGP